MLTIDELKAVHNIISRPGLKVDVTEAEGILFLKRRLGDEILKLSNPNADKKEKPVVDGESAPVVNAPIINNKKAPKKP